MIKSKNNYFINILPNFIIIKLNNNNILNINILKKRRRIKLKFKKKKKKTTLINPTNKIYNYFINFNKTLQVNLYHYNFYQKKIHFILKNKIKWNFKKFRYHGKGYKIKKFNKLSKITFRFGKSHWTKLIFNKKYIIVKRTKKNSYCCISIKNNSFLNLGNLIKKIKGVNKYTKRGVRLTRHLFKKRYGKVSQASSVYK